MYTRNINVLLVNEISNRLSRLFSMGINFDFIQSYSGLSSSAITLSNRTRNYILLYQIMWFFVIYCY
jgi:hypothetical protein